MPNEMQDVFDPAPLSWELIPITNTQAPVYIGTRYHHAT